MYHLGFFFFMTNIPLLDGDVKERVKEKDVFVCTSKSVHVQNKDKVSLK